MKWTLTARPNTTAMNSWIWWAVRDDGETVRQGNGAKTSAAAIQAARDAATDYEQEQGEIEAAVVTEEFTPSL